MENSTARNSITDCARWYAVTTYSRHEKVVAERLESKAIESFLPLATTPSRWKDRTVVIERPVFPGYVFTRIDLRDRQHVFGIPGVVKILSFNGAAAPIEDAEIEAIRLCLSSGRNPEPYPFLRTGEAVRVTTGALAGLEGLVIRHKSQLRIVVSIALIHQSIAVEIDAHVLEPVGAAIASDGSTSMIQRNPSISGLAQMHA